MLHKIIGTDFFKKTQLGCSALLLILGVQLCFAQTAKAGEQTLSPFYSVLLKDWYSSAPPAERILHIRDQVQWNSILSAYENSIPTGFAPQISAPHQIDPELKRLRDTPIDFKENAIVVLTYNGADASAGYVRISHATILANRLQLTAEGAGVREHGVSYKLSVLILKISAVIDQVQVTWHDQTIESPFEQAFKACVKRTEKEKIEEEKRYSAPLWQQPRQVDRNEPIELALLDPITPEKIEALKNLLKRWKLTPAHCEGFVSHLSFKPKKNTDLRAFEREALSIPGVKVYGITPVKDDGLKRSAVGW